MKRLLSFVSTFFKKELNRIILSLIFFVPALIIDHLGLGMGEKTSYIISFAFYLISLLIAGVPVLFSAVRGIIRGDFLDEKFLMTIASVGAMIIGEMSESSTLVTSPSKSSPTLASLTISRIICLALLMVSLSMW